MLTNHIKIAWRNLFRNKGYFFINVFGLSLALTVSFLMLLWVYDEYQTDKFHVNKDHLYLAKRTVPLEEGVLDVYQNVSYPFLKTAKEQLPEIETYITLGASFDDNLTIDNIDFRAPGAFANADFFSGFSFSILLGDITQLDKKPEAIALSESFATRIWGLDWVTKAIGSSIHVHDIGDFTVEAIFADFPASSSLQNDFYYSFEKFLNANDWMFEWTNNGMQGVFLLREDADPKLVADKLQNLFQANIKGDPDFQEGIILQKFSDNYLYGKFDEKAQVIGGRIEYVRIFTIAAIFLLIISCINFVNLSTAYATKRAGEIGVRKVIGAKRKVLIAQFFTETTLITSLSFCIAYLMTLGLLPMASSLSGKPLSMDVSQTSIWLGFLGVFIFTTLLSGAYPALVISSFKPINALKGQVKERSKTISLRKGLVVLQFGLTILLIVAAVIVRQQINYINEKDLGLSKDHIVYIHQDEKLTEKYEVLRSELLASEAITDVTLAGPSPLDMRASTSNVQWPGKTLDQGNIEFGLLWTAFNFPEVFDIPISEGRYYREGTLDTLSIVLNEKAVKIMGIEDPVGKTIQVWKKPRQIVGVLKDFHNRSLYEVIQPAIFFLEPDNAGMMFVKVKADQTSEALASLESKFEKVIPEVPLHYEFVDQKFAAEYSSELLTGTLASYFAIISILISCLGLFGLATFMARQRTKEIGIRKVLGASMGSITTLITKDFLKLVIISIFIAAPLAYYFMNGWLQNFEYRIEFQWWVIALAGILAVAVAMATICFQAIRAAMANPVKSLRNE